MTLPAITVTYDKKQDLVFLEHVKYDSRQKYFEEFVTLCVSVDGSLRKRKKAKGRGWAIPSDQFSSIQSQLEKLYTLEFKTGDVVFETLDPVEEAMDFWPKGDRP